MEIIINRCGFLPFFLPFWGGGQNWLIANLHDSRGEDGPLVFLEEETKLGPPAVNKVDLLTDGLNDREANRARSGPGSIAPSKEGGRRGWGGGGEEVANRRGGVNRCRAAEGRTSRWRETQPV